MSKKNTANFENEITKQLIKEKDKNIRELEKQQKERYINNRYEEASKLTNDIDMYINELNNIINCRGREISIDDFIKKDLEKLIIPKELLNPYIKPDKEIIRKANIIEKLFQAPKERYNLYIQRAKEEYKDKYDSYIKNETTRKREI